LPPSKQPQLSFVIVARNQSQYVEQAIRDIPSSVGAHTYEIVVVDMGSTDDTRSVASEAGADKVLALGIRSKEIGVGRGLRHAFQLVEGEVIVVVDVETFNPADVPDLVGPILAGDKEWSYSPCGLGRKRILKDPTKAYEEAVKQGIDDRSIEALIPHLYGENRLRKFLEPSPKLPQDLKNTKTRSLAQRLTACPPGEQSWREYQSICREVFTCLFVPPLAPPKEESQTRGGLQRRDLIFGIPYDVPTLSFWAYIRRRYDETAVIVDSKNLSQPLTQREVTEVSKYLSGKRLGRFGIILTRSQPSRSALKEQRRLWMDDGKMVVALTDCDLMLMLYIKERGEHPELVIDNVHRRFLEELE